MQGKTADNDIHLLVEQEMLKIKELGLDRVDRSDDEFRSEKKLLRFLQLGVEDRASPAKSRVAGRAALGTCSGMCDRRWTGGTRKSAPAKRLMMPGWPKCGRQIKRTCSKTAEIAFLQSLSGPDIQLWHGVVRPIFTSFTGDRLEAAFWIVEQDACDARHRIRFHRRISQVSFERRLQRPQETRRRAGAVRASRCRSV